MHAFVSRLACGVFVCLALQACKSEIKDASNSEPNDESPSSGPKSSKLPLAIEVPAATVTSGFVAGRMRKSVDVHAFRISTFPVTRADYDKCVEAGACKEAGKPDCALGENGPLAGYDTSQPTSPALCVGAKNARQYCEWVDAKLPTLAQWFLAARGTEPKRYSWGDAAPNCEQHPRGQRMVQAGAEGDGALVRMAPCAMLDAAGHLRVGEHQKGASPGGMQDVLLAPGELLRATKDAQFSACGDGFEDCLVTGSQPGAIESVVALRSIDAGSEEVASGVPPYGFRCVVEEK